MSTEPAPSPRHYLMCPPEFFDVRYSINVWMDPTKPTSRDLALVQWQVLHDLYVSLGHRVDVLAPLPGLPDMVFTANGAAVVDGRVLVARFRHVERAPEARAFLEWFTGRGFAPVRQASVVNEGQGDYLATRSRILGGTGFRSDPAGHAEAAELLGREVVPLELVDPRYYHLDTALAVLDGEDIMYYPPAFSASSRARLERSYPDAIIAEDADAEAFGLNAVCDGLHVVLPEAASGLRAQLRARGYEPIGLDFSELGKAGGGVKCCTLELGEAPAPPGSSP